MVIFFPILFLLFFVLDLYFFDKLRFMGEIRKRYVEAAPNKSLHLSDAERQSFDFDYFEFRGCEGEVASVQDCLPSIYFFGTDDGRGAFYLHDSLIFSTPPTLPPPRLRFQLFKVHIPRRSPSPSHATQRKSIFFVYFKREKWRLGV